MEIGAVRFNGRRVEDTWTTLVNPRRPIPGFITQLTGISNNMVRQAPVLPDVIGDLIDFAGNAPILGHNVGFDLAFLRQTGALRENISIDTYELAAVLMRRPVVITFPHWRSSWVFSCPLRTVRWMMRGRPMAFL